MEACTRLSSGLQVALQVLRSFFFPLNERFPLSSQLFGSFNKYFMLIGYSVLSDLFLSISVFFS
jgi:hypothetical protein